MKRTLWRTTWGALAFCLWLPAATDAQQPSPDVRRELEELRRGQEEIQRSIELMREVEALKKGQEEIRNELAEIKRLLQSRPAAAAAAPSPANVRVRDVVFDLGRNPVKGAPTAKLTLVEFTDYQ